MRILQLQSHLSDEELKSMLKEKRSDLSYPKWQVLYLIQVGIQTSASVISPLVNLSVHTIYKVVEGYNLHGPSFIATKPRGGRRRFALTLDQEAKLLERLKEKASNGMIKSANDIRVEVEKVTKRAVSDDYIWDLLNRHGWKKKKPRPHHPKSNVAVQEDFKKNSPSYWMPA